MTINAADMVHRYAADIAYVAEADAAADLDGLIDQLDTAARQYETAWIVGHEDIETAAMLLAEARQAGDPAARTVLLQRADVLLWQVSDMTAEYRTACGG